MTIECQYVIRTAKCQNLRLYGCNINILKTKYLSLLILFSRSDNCRLTSICRTIVLNETHLLVKFIQSYSLLFFSDVYEMTEVRYKACNIWYLIPKRYFRFSQHTFPECNILFLSMKTRHSSEQALSNPEKRFIRITLRSNM